MYGKQLDYQNIHTEGITKVAASDFHYAKKMDMAIKLIGFSKRLEDGIYAMVAPVMLNKKHPLYGVRGVFNAISMKGNLLGDVMFYGKGAGKLPTASAVASDVVDAV